MLDYLRVCLTTFPLSQPSNDLGAGEGSKFDENRVVSTARMGTGVGIDYTMAHVI